MLPGRGLFSLLLVMAALLSGGAFAGVDSSGGGELLEDRVNPWFLENTSHVSYCLDIDREAFPQDPEVLDQLVRSAFTLWTRQISLAQRQISTLKLGTQQFQYLSVCDDGADIRFQFGRLTEMQKNLLPDPQRFVGVTIRTDYDERQLKARGFVYISADRGPNRYRGADLIPEAWSLNDGLYLYYLLVHEIGHIFGVPHMGVTGTLMEASFPEALIKTKRAAWRQRLSMSEPSDILIFDPQYARINCGYRRWQQRQGLDYLDVQMDCVKFKVHDNGSFDLFEADAAAGPWRPVGTFTIKSQLQADVVHGGFVSMYLTSKNILHPIPPNTTHREIVLGIKQFGGSGLYRLQRDGSIKSLNTTYLPNTMSLDGVMNQIIRPEIFMLSGF